MKVYKKRSMVLLLTRFLLTGLVFLSLAQAGSMAVASVDLVAKPEAVKSAQVLDQQLIDQWGIELTALRMTAAGHMVDFRYRVIDAHKAAPLFKRQTKPYLVHQNSGKVLEVPNTAKVGSLRNSNMPKQGRIYWMFFGNNGLVRSGDKVSVVIGDFKAENLVVH